ncbi:M66 family metalloprotease [Acinetobacter johnsonii]|uniref:M66 family metalloprotease n=1 Tax=Acinetobacter johnsonii TaxID=40214 RepID=UPI00244BE1B6|nr:M66 family metalloprotease [Acinetobacter johnsonii]MDH1489706.1 M66 family metalloprotease [Acinetobacter johnsonii]MDH1612665.1 M66 family metalloprotease [Acinetobacter johnsonii]
MLAACGGGDGDSAEAAPEVIESTLGYFDYDANSKTRVIRNDLTGSFEAMLQFGQSHVVDPNGNESKKMPRLTMEKEALLLVTPSQAMGTIEMLRADIYMNNQWLRTIELADPTHIPQSDQTNTYDRLRVQYSKRAWSARLNWDEIRPGLRIQIKDSLGRQGQIAEDKTDFASPGELVLNNIRIGMLTAPPVSNGHYMLNDPVRAGSDYFQTIPAAEMTVAKYDDIQLDRVMIADGTIYDTASASQGGVYEGDMRENVGKSTFSVGINLANWGITSASMASQNQPQLTQTVVAHHSRGKYANGESNHGLSGGNGMLTLYDSVGNEFSHEIGHHYGLGHYPGQEGDNQFWTSHHADSGWGYIPYRNMMRGNLIWNNKDLWGASTGIANFLALYPHSRDAMSGGYASSSVSRYTHYTGYSTYLKIQPHFNRYVWDKTSPTGYKKWNEVTRQMEVVQPTMPDSAAPVWYQPKQNYLRPRVFGEPVVTILGGYDPVAKVGLLYPAARSNWGNVYDLPAANTALNQDACWLNVQYPNIVTNIALAPTRLGSNANKLHVNLALADHPQKVDLYCKQANAAAKLLSTTVIPQYATAIIPAVKIGKAQGYKALRDVELPLLEQELLNQAANNIIVLSPNGLMLYQAYKSYKNEMSLAAQQVLERYGVQESKLMRLNRWVNVYYDDLAKDVPAAIDALNAFIKQLGLQQDDPLAQSGLLKNNKNCLKTELASNQKMDVYISGPSACTADDTEQWVYDSLGRIHSKAAMGQCLTGNGGSAKVTLTDCVANNAAQVWSMDATTSAIKQSGQCLDLNSGNLVNNRQIAIRYGCSGNNNQRWTMLNQNTSLILAGVTSKNIGILVKNLKAQSLN